MTNSPSSAQAFLSIVVPTFRREGYLPPLFDALAAQIAGVAAKAEVVLVDNSPEATAREVAGTAPEFLRYVHEPSPGVARARNRGVAEARGTHIIFLDDDELPDPGWLSAFAAAADAGAKAAFGPIEPQFESPPPDDIRAPLDRVFSRRLPAADGADITASRAYLGSGNSMFAASVLALVSPPFDTAFDGGGEDVWLLRHLVDDHGVRLVWCTGAQVRELVPKDRATMAFLRRRRFSDGQLRALIESGRGGAAGAGRVAFWMAAGAAQAAGHGLAALVTRPFAPARSVRHALAATGGLGKLLWWRRKLAR